VAGGLDFNHDGFADVVAATGAGTTYVYFGAPGGTSPTPSATLINSAGVAGSTTEVVRAGDVNGDGYDDVAVLSGTSTIYVYLGTATVNSVAPAWTLSTTPQGPFHQATVSSAGDVNHDGFADLVITTGSGIGVFLGSASGLAATPATTLTVPPVGSSGPVRAVGGAGDLNGDGFDDIALAANGAVYVYFGGASGVSDSPSVELPSPAPAAGLFGQFVAPAGDMDQDGYPDLLVGASGAAFVFPGSASGPQASSVIFLADPTEPADLFGIAVAGLAP
jgi:hypothetical protein